MGRLRLRVLDRHGATVRLVEPDAVGESVALARNDEQDVRAVRLVREGWVRPPVTVDHDLVTGAEHPVHQQEVRRSLDGFRCEVVHAVADDGVAGPAHPGAPRGAGARSGPCLLYGYGAYESSLDPEFWPEMLPLLDRGVTLAIAHVRGGGELGRDWWQQGRLLRKRSTFTDFLACARHLVTSGVAAPDRIAARGLSAGGLLMGAVTHLAPDDLRAGRGRGAVRGRRGDHARRHDPADRGGVGGVGRPAGPGAVRLPAGLLPLRQPARAASPGAAGHREPQRPARLGARAGQVGGQDPGRGAARRRPRTTYRCCCAPRWAPSSHTGPAGRYDAWAYEAFLHAVTLDRLGLT